MTGNYKIEFFVLVLSIMEQLPDEIYEVIFSHMSIKFAIKFRTLSRRFANLIYRSVVDIDSYADIRNIPADVLSQFINIASLNFKSRCHNPKYTGVFKKLVNLTKLRVYQQFTVGIQLLTKLQRLEINYISNNGQCLQTLTSLTHLQINNSSSIVFDEYICGLTNLTYLQCHRQFTDIVIRSLPNLTHLILNDNDEISDSAISGATQLKSLDISWSHQITDEGILRLTNLTYLMTNKNITDKGIHMLTSLTQIMPSRFITDDGLRRLPFLTHLGMSHAQKITNQCIQTLTNLIYLKCYHGNYIMASTIGCLTNLTYLRCTDDFNITDNTLMMLTNLKHLDLVGISNITDISISKLTSLTHLNIMSVKNNGITKNGISVLINLTSLKISINKNISNHDLDTLPRLTKLKLYMDHNRIIYPGFDEYGKVVDFDELKAKCIKKNRYD